MATRALLPFTLLLSTRLALAQPSPVFLWPLNETSGTTTHEAYTNATGILQGGATWAPGGGHHGGACRFDGVDDRIILGPCEITTGGPGFSLSLWVKPDLVTGMERTLLAKTVGTTAQDHIWSMALVSGSVLRFRLRTGPSTTELSTSPSSIFGGAWYNVVGSFDGSTMRIYLNGALMAETAAAGAMGFHPQAPASIAALSTGNAPFSGWVDDVRLFDRGLSQQDVVDILLGDDIATSGPGASPRLLPDGRLLIPHGPWSHGLLLDASGRMVRPLESTDLTNGIDLNRVPPGLYLVHVRGAHSHGSWPVMAQ